MKNYFQELRKEANTCLRNQGVLGEILTTPVTPKGLASLVTAGAMLCTSLPALAQQTTESSNPKILTEEKGNQIIADYQKQFEKATQSLEHFANLKYITLGKGKNKETVAQLDSLGYEGVKISVGATEALNAGLLESMEGLVKVYADGTISPEEAREASKSNYFRPNSRLTEGLKDIARQIAYQVAAASAANPKTDYTTDKNKLKELEDVIANIEEKINSEIEPLSSELEQAFNQYNQPAPLKTAAIEHAQRTAWYNTLGLNNDWSKKGIIKKAAWAGLGTGLYFLIKGKDGKERIYNTGDWNNNTY